MRFAPPEAGNQHRFAVIARCRLQSERRHDSLCGCRGDGADEMNRILGIDNRNMIAEVEPGVCHGAEFQAAVEKQGLFYPPDRRAALSVPWAATWRRMPAVRVAPNMG